MKFDWEGTLNGWMHKIQLRLAKLDLAEVRGLSRSCASLVLDYAADVLDDDDVSVPCLPNEGIDVHTILPDALLTKLRTACEDNEEADLLGSAEEALEIAVTIDYCTDVKKARALFMEMMDGVGALGARIDGGPDQIFEMVMQEFPYAVSVAPRPVKGNPHVVVRVNKTEFELGDGRVFQHFYPYEEDPPLDLFQEEFDSWKAIFNK